MEVFLVIPLYRPDVVSVEFLYHLRETLPLKMVVVNDGSGSEYQTLFERIAQIPDCMILNHSANLGKGRALKTAFAYLAKNFPAAAGVVTCDGDGQHTIDDIERCYRVFQQNPEKIILAVRDFSGKNIPWKSRLGNRISTFLFRKLAQLELSDTQCGLRALPMDFIKILPDKPGERFEFETIMLLESCNKANGKVFDIEPLPIQTVYQINHRTNFRSLRDSYQIIKILLKNRQRSL